MFSKDYEFRYGDLDCGGNIKVSAILELLQDISVRHSDSVGSTAVMPESAAWLLEGWRVKILNPIKQDKVTIDTGIMDMTGIRSPRKYELYQGGKLCVIATAVWYLVDMEKRRIMKVPAEVSDAFDCITEEDNGLPYISLKPVSDGEVYTSRSIERRDLDTNRHLNNVKSIEIALESIPEDFDFTELSVKYRKEILRDEEVRISSVSDAESVQVELANSSGESCVLVKVIK